MKIKHRQWLRLQAQGELVTSTLKTQNYQIQKQRDTLHWRLSKEGQADYLFCWLPSPVGHWVLLPNDCTKVRYQLLELIHQTLAQSSYQPLFPLEHYGHSQTGTRARQSDFCPTRKVTASCSPY